MNLKTYESLDKFLAVQANPGDLTLVDAPGLPGKKAWQVKLSPTSTLWDKEQRVHCCTDEFLQPGQTVSFGSAYYLPTDRPAGKGFDSMFEIHQGWHGPDLSYNGPAPGCGLFNDDRLTILTRGGAVVPVNRGASSFVQNLWGGYPGAKPFTGGQSPALVKGRWFTVQVTLYLHQTAGWVKAERDGVEIVAKTVVPTCYPFGMYGMPVNGYRQGSSNPNTATHFQWSAIGDEAEVRKYLVDYVGAAPAGPTVAELVDKAVAELQAATILYPTWASRVKSGYYGSKDPSTATSWGRGLHLLDRVKDSA